MQERHKNREQYFREQSYTTEHYVIPFIDKIQLIDPTVSVLEIGCGEGGNMLPFLQRGCRTVGVDMNKNKIANAQKFYATLELPVQPDFFLTDIYEWNSTEQFDLILMRDVLEHIHNQERFFRYVKKFLKPKGKIFVGFPPWQNPYGGHQQIFESWVSKLPYIHLLPTFAYKGILSLMRESPHEIRNALEIKETRITIERFFKIVKQEDYRVEQAEYYFINPNYQIKFGLKPRRQWKWITKMPWIRNFVITTCYVLLTPQS